MDNAAMVAAPAGPAFALPQFSSVLGAQEDICQPTYDRANYAQAGQFEIFFFTIPVGSQATLIRGGAAANVVKTRRDTNMEQQGVLPTKSLDIRGISVHLIPLQAAIAGAGTPSIGDNKSRLYHGGFLELRIVDKPRLYLPLVLFKNLDPDFSMTTAAATTIYTAGGVGGGVYWIEQSPVVIPANTNFSARMQFDGSPALVTDTFDIYLVFHGYQRRPAQ